MSNKGFTLIELVMVIVILGLLAAVAIPKYQNLQVEAKQAAEDGTVGGVRGGISVWHADALVNGAGGWPPVLDYAANNSDAGKNNPFFVSVLDYPITKDWSKDGTGGYVGPTKGDPYTYTPLTGSFEQ